MRVKIKYLDGTCDKVDVDEASTILCMSSKYCQGHKLAVGFPPHLLNSDDRVSNSIRPGELVIVLPEIINTDRDDEALRKKERKRARKLAKRAAKNAKIEEAVQFLVEECDSVVNEPNQECRMCKH